MPWIDALRDTARTGLHLDRTLTNPKRAARGALAVALVLFPTLALGGPRLATSAAMGAFIAGTATFQRSFRPRPSLAVAAGIGLGISTFTGYLSVSVPGLFPVVLAAWALLAGLAWSVGPTGGVVAATTVSVMLVVVQLPVSVPTALGHALLCALGGVVQAAVITLWPIDSWRAQRDALADAYRSLADYARQLREDPTTPVDPAALITARSASELTPWQDRHRPPELRGLRGLAESMRPALTALADPRGGAPESGAERARVCELLAAAAETLDALALAIRTGEPLDLPRAATALVSQQHGVPPLPGPARAAARQVAALLGRAVDTLDHGAHDGHDTVAAPTSVAGGALLRPSLFGMVPLVLRAVRRQLDPGSPVLRHAVRLATVVTVAHLVAEMAGLHRAYWAPLTAAMVIRPDFGQTFSRGVARLAGTAVGVAVSTVLVELLHPGPWWSAALAVLCIGGAYLTNRTGYALMTACVSAYVVLLLGLQGGRPLTIAGERIGLTLLGGAVALLIFAFFPSWASARLADRLADWITASGRYCATVLTVFGDPPAHSRQEVRAALLDARAARAELVQAVERAEAEPVRDVLCHALPANQLEKARAAVGLVARTGLLLEAHLPAPDARPVPGAERFAAALVDATAVAATAVAAGHPVDFSRLREAQRAWEEELRAAATPDTGAPDHLDHHDRLDLLCAASRLLAQAVGDLERAMHRGKTAPRPRAAAATGALEPARAGAAGGEAPSG
ncbi:putative membrane protein YccC [Kitasatospora sp. GAS204A]|uniref:FUSC family protein n=1 Tax=unclassified Kitasatospora TaxID=2633591 RepID=UPI002473C535|nr:FUSC family protein [Kitasatospora sp. GAS204B]MDH6118462.1 putative membrane protein YccC [Kitasatospora sp. GAS204B]